MQELSDEDSEHSQSSPVDHGSQPPLKRQRSLGSEASGALKHKNATSFV
jgi:hypothetical protein